MANAADLLAGLRIPLMAAPMSIASSRELVAAACRAGIVGCFPIQNANRHSSVGDWLAYVMAANERAVDDGLSPAPFAVNINVSRALPASVAAEALAACRAVSAPVVTTNAGDPREAIRQVHDWGGLVIHDATTIRQAERAISAGVDGLMLVCAGAGGLGGTLNPFSFVPAVRRMFDGLIQVAGGVASGAGIRAAQVLGADMVCMGTRFIATVESGSPPAHKQMLVDVGIEDVLFTDAIAGLPANFLRSSIIANGLDPDGLLPAVSGRPSIARDIKPWSMVYSGGQSLALIDHVPTVGELVDQLAGEYEAARG